MKFDTPRTAHACFLTMSLFLVAGCGSGSGSQSAGTAGASCSARPQARMLNAGGSGPYLDIPEAEKNAQGSAGFTKLASHIPAAVKRFSDQGKMPEDQQLSVTVALGLNNESALQDELAEMYRPGSPTYHQFLTPAQFAERYAPTEEQVQQAQAFLEASGLTPTTVSENRLLVHATGTVGAINTMAHTEIHQYRDSAGSSYYSPAYELQLPAGTPIQAVLGIQNVTRLHPYSMKKATANPGKASTPNGATGPDGGFAPSDIKTAYQIPTNVNGSGQTLGLFELDGYTPSDITTYEQEFGLPNVPLQNVLVDSASGSAGGGASEVTLDIELMASIAPGASQILVYEGPNDDQGMLDTYSKIASDNQAKTISTSWGSSEDGTDSSLIQSENTIFEQMAAQGQSIFAAAGDSGAYDDGSSLSVDDPSAQPYMVSAGGTELTTSSSGAYSSETTWNDGGGGVSSVWTVPSWQSPVTTSGWSSSSKGSTTMRNVPDVSINADIDTGYAIYTQGSWGVWGGTSCAAPLWAAYTALVNQQRAANGLGPLGFPNPELYAVGQGSRYGSDFHDIADGSTNQYYPAIQGYDDATGWGSPIGTGLFQDLSSDPATSGSTASCN